MNRTYRLLMVGLWVIGCGHPVTTGPVADGIDGQTVASARPLARAIDRHRCTAARVSPDRGGNPVVRVTCQRLQLALARQPARPRYLRTLLSGGRSPAAISDRDIRATEEYRSLMDPRNRWQWADRVTSGEALGMCRAMLDDLHALRRVDWDKRARHYLALVRRQGAQAQPRQKADGGRADGEQPVPAQDGVPERPDGDADGDGRGHTPRPGARPGDGPGGRPTPAPRVVQPVAIDIDRLLDRSWQLHHEGRLRGRRAGQRESTWTALEQRLAETEEHIGAVTELLSGVSILISGVVIRGAATDVTIEAVGEMTGDPQLNLRLSEPGVEALADDLHALGDLEDALGSPTGAYQSPLDQAQQDAFRQLLRRPMRGLDELDLEQLDRLRERAGDTGELRPGSRLHKARRWREYQQRNGSWRFERWSTTYEQNMTRAREAHARADRLRDKLGWGQREVRVDLPDGRVRVLDIGDKGGLRGVEVKRGYVTLDADIARELRKDASLVQDRGWSMTWHVDGRCSQPLRDTLRRANIKLVELRGDTPIKDL